MTPNRRGYYNAAGQRVPAVTSILKTLGWSQDALMAWAWRQGTDGKEFRETSDQAATIGRTAHAMVEAHIHGREFDTHGLEQEILYPAEQAFGMYRAWEQTSRHHIIATEIEVVSEAHQFGGRPDALMRSEQGRLSLPDWKTGGGIYAESLIQVAAYVMAIEEVMKLTIDGGAWLFRFDRESAGFVQKWIPRDKLGVPWRVFLRLREVYDAKKDIDKLAR